tara:strand:- start:4349 stop:4957 length:609 start_codon:yes stop_codon:yes gene_type:complete
MANANRPSGFSPIEYLNGSSWNGQARLYSIAAAYNVALYVGDPVISSGTSDSQGIPGIALAAATGAVRGVIVGIGNTKGLIANVVNPNISYRPAAAQTTDWFAMVVDDPNVLFEVQEESNGTQLAATDIGLNTISKVGTGNGYVSGWMIPSTTGAAAGTGATLQIRLMGLKQVYDNVFGAYAKHLIKFNVHELGTGTGAAGV